MTGKIIKGIGGFYYVVCENGVTYECKAKGVFRNRKIKPLVGDDVEFSVLDEEAMEGNIDEILPRKNELIRPAAANVDQALVLFALTHPAPNLNLLDRFLVMMSMEDIPVKLCFNKQDLGDEALMDQYRSIYEAAGYPVYFISAREETGIEQVRSASGQDNCGCRPIRRGKIFSYQPDPAGSGYGNRRYQPQDRAWKTYHPPFTAVFCGKRYLYDGHTGLQLHVHTGYRGK